jgi:hypothetical protein
LGTFGHTQEAPMGGYVSEVMVFDSALSSGDRTEIFTYLHDKYGNLVSNSTRGTSEASPIES